MTFFITLITVSIKEVSQETTTKKMLTINVPANIYEHVHVHILSIIIMIKAFNNNISM